MTRPAGGPRPDGGPLPVTLVMRRPVPGWFSIETVFATVVDHLPADVVATVHVLPCRSTGLIARVRNIIDVVQLRRRPGVLHVTGDVHYVALALPGSRTVLTVHDTGTADVGSPLRRRLISLLWFRLPVRRAARTTTVSAATRASLLRLVPARADRVVVVPNPLPPDLAPTPRRDRTDRPVVLAIGATPNKNLARLFAAIAPLDVDLLVVGHVDPADVRLLDAGDPSVRARLSVHRDLPREDLRSLYARADVLAMVSTSEGFGLPVIEAQAVGVPVVASAIPALREVAGAAARFVDPTDVAAIRTAVLEVLEDAALRDRLVRDGHENAGRFAADAVAAAYAAIYRDVARATAPTV